MTKIVSSCLVFALVAALSSCGFKLRSYSLEANVESFFIDAAPQQFLRSELRQALRSAGAQETSDRGDAALIIHLLDGRADRRSASTSGSARVAEYALELGVQFALSNAAGEELSAPQWLRRERVFRVNRENIVGNNEEQVLIEREMRTDLVQAMVRTINAVTQTATATSAVDA